MSEVREVVRYKWEYGNFLEFVKKRKIERAMIYAKSLGIDRKTLVHWFSQPELREAMAQALDQIIDGMQRAGKDDWRMYKELYTMLGLDDIKNVDVTSAGEKLPTPILGGLSGLSDNDSDQEASETQ